VTGGTATRESIRLVKALLAGEPAAATRIVAAVRQGLSGAAIQPLAATGLSLEEIAAVTGMSVRTMHRRIGDHAALDLADGDRLLRLAQVFGEAVQLIGGQRRAIGWMRERSWDLGDLSPLELLAAEPGVAMVRQALGAIGYGGVA